VITYTCEDLGSRVDGELLRTWLSEVGLGGYVDDVLWVDINEGGTVTLHIAARDKSGFRFRDRDGEVATLPPLTVACTLPLPWMIETLEP